MRRAGVGSAGGQTRAEARELAMRLVHWAAAGSLGSRNRSQSRGGGVFTARQSRRRTFMKMRPWVAIAAVVAPWLAGIIALERLARRREEMFRPAGGRR
ncbi:MAG: hypothetical protein GY715_16530 [Planctomycetes bacterium]|nr:hypothetical protein [Planctomycetota bacterium]